MLAVRQPPLWSHDRFRQLIVVGDVALIQTLRHVRLATCQSCRCLAIVCGGSWLLSSHLFQRCRCRCFRCGGCGRLVRIGATLVRGVDHRCHFRFDLRCFALRTLGLGDSPFWALQALALVRLWRSCLCLRFRRCVFGRGCMFLSHALERLEPQLLPVLPVSLAALLVPPLCVLLPFARRYPATRRSRWPRRRRWKRGSRSTTDSFLDGRRCLDGDPYSGRRWYLDLRRRTIAVATAVTAVSR